MLKQQIERIHSYSSYRSSITCTNDPRCRLFCNKGSWQKLYNLIEDWSNMIKLPFEDILVVNGFGRSLQRLRNYHFVKKLRELSNYMFVIVINGIKFFHIYNHLKGHCIQNKNYIMSKQWWTLLMFLSIYCTAGQ